MESVLGRYRNLIILVGVLFLQVLGLAMQVKRSGDAENTRLIRIWAVERITPFERGLVWVAERHRQSLAQLFLSARRARGKPPTEGADRADAAGAGAAERRCCPGPPSAILLAFKEQFISKTVPAQVIGSSGSDLSRDRSTSIRVTNDGIAQTWR